MQYKDVVIECENLADDVLEVFGVMKYSPAWQEYHAKLLVVAQAWADRVFVRPGVEYLMSLDKDITLPDETFEEKADKFWDKVDRQHNETPLGEQIDGGNDQDYLDSLADPYPTVPYDEQAEWGQSED